MIPNRRSKVPKSMIRDEFNDYRKQNIYGNVYGVSE